MLSAFCNLLPDCTLFRTLALLELSGSAVPATNCCCCWCGLRCVAGRMPLDRQLAVQVAGQLDQVLQLAATSHSDAVEALGRNCHLPNSCQTPLHAVLHYEQQWQQLQQQQHEEQEHQQVVKQQVLVAAVRDALRAGGCCASRAGYVGACLGALFGVEAVPAAWLQKHESAGAVQAWAGEVCSSRKEQAG